uniref:Uncharacterized protein n=1 Tax=Anguilla anguilla TaxID=7936 RepID=A0A0E9XJN9_ANGAN
MILIRRHIAETSELTHSLGIQSHEPDLFPGYCWFKSHIGELVNSDDPKIDFSSREILNIKKKNRNEWVRS